VVEQFFFDGVLVEPGDGGQSAGDGGACPAFGFEFAGEGLDVRAADREQRQGPSPAPAGELAQVQGVGLAGEPAVPGQVPGEREPLGVSETGWTGTREVEAVAAAIMAPPKTAGTREAGPSQVPAVNDARNVRRPSTPS
jgi:hypothetical protein